MSDLLGIESRQVRALAETGAIARVARGVFDRTSVERYRLGRGSGRTRTWAEHTAWGAIALLSNAPSLVVALGLGDSQRSRLRATLREVTDPTELAVRLRDRAVVYTCAGRRSVVERIRGEIVVPRRKRLGMVEDESTVDGYLRADRVADLVHRYRLTEDPAGSIVLRSTGVDIGLVRRLAAVNRTLSAVDAATSIDPRERGVGERHLVSRLELFRENDRLRFGDSRRQDARTPGRQDGA